MTVLKLSAGIGLLLCNILYAAAPEQPYTWQNACIKGNGFIDGIVYSPTQPNLVYIHTDMGGACRWDESDKKWTPLNDFSPSNDPALNSLGVETLAIDPTDPNKVYMACGTYMSPTAIFRTTDGGHHWMRTDTPIKSNGNGTARNTGERLRVDPNSPNILFYGTRVDGLWKSIDSGANWSRVESFPVTGEQKGAGRNTGIVWMLFDPSSGSAGKATPTLYAGVVLVSASQPRIFRSTDGGKSWQPLPGDQPTKLNTFPQRAALTPDGKTLYLTYSFSTSSPGPYGLSDGFVRKVSAPASTSPTWKDITPPAKYGYSAVALDPTDPNTLYVGEINDYNPADRIWRSTDAGLTWKATNPQSHRDDSSAPYVKTFKIHWLGDLEIDPHNRNVAMFTTGYGLYRTSDLTADEPTWAFFNDGFEQSAVLEFASPNQGDVHLFSAIGDRDGYRHADFNVTPPEGVLGQTSGLAAGTSDDIDVAWNDANQVVRLVRKAPFMQYSNDNGMTWKWMPEVKGTARGERDGGNEAISADASKVAFQPAGGKLCYSTRDGDHWSAWTDSTGDVPQNARLVTDTAEPHTFFAYSGTTIAKSTDGGATWKTQTTHAPQNGNWIRAVFGHAGHLVMSLESGQGVYRSTDSGTNWTRLSPEAVTEAFAVGVGAPKPGSDYPALFIAGIVDNTTGFFRSDDQGQTWVRINDDDHQFGHIIVIQGDPRVYGRLYVGANGRGVLVGDRK